MLRVKCGWELKHLYAGGPDLDRTGHQVIGPWLGSVSLFKASQCSQECSHSYDTNANLFSSLGKSTFWVEGKYEPETLCVTQQKQAVAICICFT